MSVLFLLCTTLTVFGGDSNDHWLEVKSPHFIVLTNSNNKQAIRIASQFEQMRSVFHTLLPNASSDVGSPIIAFEVEQSGKSLSLYNNNYYKVIFTLANYETQGDLKPCSDIEGMKAKIGYAEVSGAVVAVQILTIELSK